MMVQSALTSVNISAEILVSSCVIRNVSIPYLSWRGIKNTKRSVLNSVFHLAEQF